MARPAGERDRALLLDIVLSARDALSFVEGLDAAAFRTDRLRQNAVIRCLEVVGEAAGKSLMTSHVTSESSSIL